MAEISSYSSTTTKVVSVCQPWLLELAVACSTSQSTTNQHIPHVMQSISTSRNLVSRATPCTYKRKQDDLELFSCYNMLVWQSPPVHAVHLDDLWVRYGLCAESTSTCCNSPCCCRLRPPVPSMVIEHKSLSLPVTTCKKMVFYVNVQQQTELG
jgi:hypothetical protein